jgi:hypothetical protein
MDETRNYDLATDGGWTDGKPVDQRSLAWVTFSCASSSARCIFFFTRRLASLPNLATISLARTRQSSWGKSRSDLSFALGGARVCWQTSPYAVVSCCGAGFFSLSSTAAWRCVDKRDFCLSTTLTRRSFFVFLRDCRLFFC